MRPGAPTQSLTAHVGSQQTFLEAELQPALDAAAAGTGHVFFVDAAHFVFGTFLGRLWSVTRVFVRAASGRQRFHVLGAWNAVTRRLVTVTNTTVVNTDTMGEWLRAIAAEGLVGPVTVVLDNARYQRNRAVQGLEAELGIRLLYLPSYSPNLNRIERLWGFAKRRSVHGRYHPDFASFRSAIEATLAGIPTTQQSALDPRGDSADRLHDAEPVHVQHHHVHKRGADVPATAADCVDGVLPVGRDANDEPFRSERSPQRKADRLLVVGDQHLVGSGVCHLLTRVASWVSSLPPEKATRPCRRRVCRTRPGRR